MCQLDPCCCLHESLLFLKEVWWILSLTVRLELKVEKEKILCTCRTNQFVAMQHVWETKSRIVSNRFLLPYWLTVTVHGVQANLLRFEIWWRKQMLKQLAGIKWEHSGWAALVFTYDAHTRPNSFTVKMRSTDISCLKRETNTQEWEHNATMLAPECPLTFVNWS